MTFSNATTTRSNPDRQQKTPIHLLDGGLGTTLADEYNCTFNSTTTPLWSSSLLLSSPSTLLAAQTAFANAGADLLLTDTYQASFHGFASEGCTTREETETKMRSAVSIAHSAFASSSSSSPSASTTKTNNGRVVLGLGAYGATMVPGQEYTGNYDLKKSSELRDWHAERLAVFEERDAVGNIDMIGFETIPLLQEIEVLRDVMTSAPDELSKKKFWISCVFPNQEKGMENFLPDGSSVEKVVYALLGDSPSDGDEEKKRRKPDFVGVNCTKMAKLPSLILEFEKEISTLVSSSSSSSEGPDIGLVLYPDGTNGEVYNTTTQEWEIREPREGEQEERAKSWDERIWDVLEEIRERGFWREIIVGGCCKTVPKDIAGLRKRIDQDAL